MSVALESFDRPSRVVVAHPGGDDDLGRLTVAWRRGCIALPAGEKRAGPEGSHGEQIGDTAIDLRGRR